VDCHRSLIRNPIVEEGLHPPVATPRDLGAGIPRVQVSAIDEMMRCETGFEVSIYIFRFCRCLKFIITPFYRDIIQLAQRIIFEIQRICWVTPFNVDELFLVRNSTIAFIFAKYLEPSILRKYVFVVFEIASNY